jgi:hypothetical protein
VAHLGGGKMTKRGQRSFDRRGFYSRRRERELAAGPHVGVNGQHRGGPAAAAVSGRARASPVPSLLTGRAAVGLNRPGPL